MAPLFRRRRRVEPASEPGPAEPDPALEARRVQAAEIATRRPGRPSAGAAERTKRIGLSVSEAEHEVLSEAAQQAGRSQVARWCRDVLLAQARTPAQQRERQGQVLAQQVARVGSNLNQLVRAVNQGAVAGEPVETADVLEQVSQIRADLARLSQQEGS